MGTLEMAAGEAPGRRAPRPTRGMRSEPVAILELAPAPGVIASGRRWVTETARAQGAADETADLVELLASELLTNALRHGPTEGRVVVHVTRRRHLLRITVHDGGDAPPVLRPAEPSREGGRGLHLVDALATSWGVDHDYHGGKSVWFEAPLA